MGPAARPSPPNSPNSLASPAPPRWHQSAHSPPSRSYPSFVDALRDLDDALTMVHLFATLPAEAKYGIPTQVRFLARTRVARIHTWKRGTYTQFTRARENLGSRCRAVRGGMRAGCAAGPVGLQRALGSCPCVFCVCVPCVCACRTQEVQKARRLALEWQAFVVRDGGLRRVFVSVKGYYFQASAAQRESLEALPECRPWCDGRAGGRWML